MRASTAILFLFIFLFGCSSEIDHINLSESQPIVYCLLNPGESKQYALVNKTYIGAETGAQPDSAEMLQYQEDIQLSLEIVEQGEALASQDFSPIRVEKDSGYFSGSYKIVYCLESEIRLNTMYRLIIYIPSIDKIIYSYTTTVGGFKIIDPAYPEVRPIHLLSENNPVFHWTRSENANMYQVAFILHYIESDSAGFQVNEVLIPLNTVVRWDDPGYYFSQDINAVQVYKTISNLLPLNPSVVRSFDSMDVVIISGGNELTLNYQRDIQKDPFRIFDYSNIKNGVGVFSSVYYQTNQGFGLTDRSLDSLAYGRFTRELNFLDSDGNRK